MPVLNRIAGLADEMKEWRRWLHRNPELGFDLPKTAAFVETTLREFGVDHIETGIAQTGIVAVIENGTRPDQRVVAGTLAELETLVAQNQINGPALIVTHGITLRMMRMIAMGWDMSRFEELPQYQGAVQVVRDGHHEIWHEDQALRLATPRGVV